MLSSVLDPDRLGLGLRSVSLASLTLASSLDLVLTDKEEVKEEGEGEKEGEEEGEERRGRRERRGGEGGRRERREGGRGEEGGGEKKGRERKERQNMKDEEKNIYIQHAYPWYHGQYSLTTIFSCTSSHNLAYFTGFTVS